MPEASRVLGIDNILYETDFPHPTCVYPDPIKFVAEVAEGFTPEERRKVFGVNAAKLYKIDLAKLA
jgi:predicted TIM-barrel fold metal-dependent hydrolase